MDDPISDGLNAAGDLLNTEPVKNLLSPVTKEVGLVLGTIGSLVRFYCEDNLQKVFTKWARQRNRKPLAPPDFTRAIPLLQAASLCSDDELQERWAALLESSVTQPEGVLPSFGHTLSQLTPEEARFLERLYANREKMDSLDSLDCIFLSMEPQDLSKKFDDMFHHFEKWSSECKKRSLLLSLMLQDFSRLGLIVDMPDVVEEEEGRGERKEFSQNDLPRFLRIGIRQKLKSSYHFSEYGSRFIQAVTPKL